MIHYWGFWLGLYLIMLGILYFLIRGGQKRKTREKRDVEKLLRRQRMMVSGYHPCQYRKGYWHEGVCIDVGCPTPHYIPQMGAPRYADSNR